MYWKQYLPNGHVLQTSLPHPTKGSDVLSAHIWLLSSMGLHGLPVLCALCSLLWPWLWVSLW